MNKPWMYFKRLTLLKSLGAVACFLYCLIDGVRWMLGKISPYLAPVGRLFLLIARLTRLSRVLNWKDLVLVSKSYWTSDSRQKAFGLLLATLFCMLANAKAAYYFGLHLGLLNDIVCRQIFLPGVAVQIAAHFDILNSHVIEGRFFLAITQLAGIAAFWAVVNIGYGTFRTYLAIDWRFWLSNMHLRQYVKNEAYLRLKIDNPDQRLAQDPDVFANTTVGLSMIVVETVVNLWTFFPVLYQSSKLLTICCLACAAASYIAVLWLGRKLPALTGQQYDSEATLRTQLQDGPRYGPTIALQRCENIFLAQSIKKLGVVRQVLTRVMKVNLYVGVWNFFSGKVVENAALAAIGWLVMHGRATMGQIAQAGQAFSNVYNGLTVITSQYGVYSTLKAELERLGPFARALEEIGENRMPKGQWVEYAERESDVISFDDVTIISSHLSCNPVVAGITIDFDVDTLITGRDGHGKTDLAKALGLGAAQGTGKITRPARDRIMIITQSPYVPVSTLREYLRDMKPSDPDDDQRLLTTLALVGLHCLVEQSRGENSGGLDTVQDWSAKISSAQLVQLCLARAILSKPFILVVDQAADCLEAETESDIFKVLRGLGIRLITMSNSDRLANSHKRVIELGEDGCFRQARA